MACLSAVRLYLIYRLHRALHQSNRKDFSLAQNGILSFVLRVKCDLKCITFLTGKSNPSPLTILQLISNKTLYLACGKYDLLSFDRLILRLTVASSNNGSILKGKLLTFAFEHLTTYHRDHIATTERSTAAFRRFLPPKTLAHT